MEKYTPHSLCLIRFQFDVYGNCQNNGFKSFRNNQQDATMY